MGRTKGVRHKKLHFTVSVLNQVTDEWILKGQYATIRSIVEDIGYNYNIIQNIRLGRHKMLSKFIRISRIPKIQIVRQQLA